MDLPLPPKFPRPTTKTSRHYRQLSRRNASHGIRSKVTALVGAQCAGKQVKLGETMADFMRRVAQAAFKAAEEAGFTMDVDLPENMQPAPWSHINFSFVLRPRPKLVSKSGT